MRLRTLKDPHKRLVFAFETIAYRCEKEEQYSQCFGKNAMTLSLQCWKGEVRVTL